MHCLERHEGPWVGTNAFRLMPADPTHDAPFRATVTRGANGEVATIAYSWMHPDDGDQDGVLVLGRGTEPNVAVAFWGDSWHQRPEPSTLDGSRDGNVVTVGYVYGGEWRWEIVVDATDPDRLVLTMRNVVPASAATSEIPAGPYAAMRAVLGRSG